MPHPSNDNPNQTQFDQSRHYNPSQPRVPAGRHEGGQWTRDIIGSQGAAGANVPVRGQPLAPAGQGSAGNRRYDFGHDDRIVEVASLRGLGLPRPGQGPVPPAPPDFLDWQRQTGETIMQLWRFWNLLQRITIGSGVGSGGDRNGPGCKEEWDDAREACTEELAKPNPRRGFTGGYNDVENCARGHVTEDCGGNPKEHLDPDRSRTGRSPYRGRRGQ